MAADGANMAARPQHGRARYRKGCRCDLCKQAESEYQIARRRKIAESVGEFAAPVAPGLRLLNGSADKPSTCTNAAATAVNPQQTPANSVVAAVSAEIEAMGGHTRPGLAAACVAMAAILDNNRAISTQPAAAGKLAEILDQLRRSAKGSKPKLASVRAMTSENRK